MKPAPEAGADGGLRAAREWIAGDPDPGTRAELEAIVGAGDAAALGDRMVPLEFGTAGLRGVVGAGPGRMNRAVVIRVTRALADHLWEACAGSDLSPVVVGHDARPSSRELAGEVIGVLAAARVPVRYFEAAVPTPLVAYAQKQLGGSAAVVITASHNPAEYNGYKLYGANAAQIAPPVDADIAARTRSIGPARSVPRAEDARLGAHPLARPVPDGIFRRYLADVDALRPGGEADRSLRIVYTPLHGVGRRLVEAALRGAGFRDVRTVPEQAEPDGRFPTTPFPNPEEPGVLDLAVDHARREGADLVLANDPDVDRLAVCVPGPDGEWVALSGNRIGLLLADFLLEHAPESPQPLVVSTVVSSPMLDSIARHRGARLERTLTGFKWIFGAALELERQESVRFVFGYEEALGYAAGRVVHDKDGISAALLFAELAARCRARGVTVLERLSELHARHGLWVSAQHGVACAAAAGRERLRAGVDRIAKSPPALLGGRRTALRTDYRIGAEHRPRWRPAAELVELEVEGGRVLLRPSGTEPKLKIYVDLHDASGSAGEGELVAEARRIAEELASYVGVSG